MRTLFILLTILFVISKPAVAAQDAVEKVLASAEVSGESPLSFALDFQFGWIDYYRYRVQGDQGVDSMGETARLGLEYLPIVNYGKLGIGLGFGIFGLRNTSLGGERYASLLSFPLDAYVTYRFDYVKNQILVPYVKGGSTLTWVRQTSKTGASVPGTRTSRSWDYGAGLELCLNQIDSTAAKNFDRSAGVNNTYLTFEYMRSDTTGDTSQFENPDLSNASYRLGLRFEM